MILLRAWVFDPLWVFIRHLSINLYLSFFVYLNFLIKNLGFDINNKKKKRKPRKILKETTLFILAISPMFMLYFLL